MTSVFGYLGALGIVIAGGAYGAQALLSTVPPPSFLVPEYLSAADTNRSNSERAAPRASVQFMPYRPPPPLQTTSKPSIARGYVVRVPASPPKPIETAEVQNQSKKAKPIKRKVRNQNREAMDAFASGASWR